MTSPPPDPIEIVCGVDSRYAPHLGVMLRSLAMTNPGQPIRVHVLHDGVDALLRRTVDRCAAGLVIEWYGVTTHCALGFPPLLQITRATYLRLTMTEHLPASIKRVLYLDVDMIVNGSLLPLWTLDLAGKACAAVIDPGIDPDNFATRHALSPGLYFNAGVILFDLEKVRKKSVLERAVTLLADRPDGYEFADQDALNIVLWNDWLPVDPAWNFQRKFLYRNFAAWHLLSPLPRKAPLIVHYTEQEKPWQRTEWHPYAWLYIKNLPYTPFRTQVMRAGGMTLFHALKWWLRLIFKRPVIFRGTRKINPQAIAAKEPSNPRDPLIFGEIPRAGQGE
jgi:lipopolysaccharide biosynthesis glycosyltransferase